MSIELTDEGREKIRQALLRKALEFESIWKSEVPVYRGQYKNSITSNFVDDFRIEVGTNLDYAPILEYGLGEGEFPNIDELRKWVDRKVNPAEENLDQVTYLVGRKIMMEGVDENHSLQRAVRKFKTQNS